MSQNGQFSLLNTRRFLPYFLTQALGAFNDNLYKNALLLFITFGLMGQQQNPALLTNLAAGLFILPFFIFSPVAGQIADKMEKSRLIRWIKLAEIAIMFLAAGAVLFDSLWLMMTLLFLMGLQSAIFGPVKFAFLPQQLKQDEIVGGNALVEMGTFLAILVGTISAGLLFDFESNKFLIATGILLFAIAGYFTSTFIPTSPANDPELKVNWNPFTEFKHTFSLARKNHAIFLSIMAISWFWFMGASYLTQFPNFAKQTLGGNTQVVTLLLTLFSMGVGLGSLLCEKLSDHKIELGIVPIGSIGMSLFGIDLYFAISQIHIIDNMDAITFISQSENWRMMFDIAMISTFGGIFIVPLQAVIQTRSEEQNRARIIAANNMFNALFMVASAIFSIIALVVIKITITEYFLILAIMNIIVAIYVYTQVPEFALRFCIWILSHTMYRVTKQGLDNIPEQGPAVLVCNHVSYVDAMLIAGAYHRPIRFVMDRGISEMPGLKHFFRMAKTIPICSPKANADVYETAFKRIKEELDAGNLVCIFPEGKITKNGNIDTFKKGIERILKESPVDVIPLSLNGLWGSYFSHKGGHALTTRPKRFWSKVQLNAGPKCAGSTSNALELESKVKALFNN